MSWLVALRGIQGGAAVITLVHADEAYAASMACVEAPDARGVSDFFGESAACGVPPETS